MVFRMADGTLERVRDLNLRAQTGRYALFEHYWSTGQCQPKFLGIGAEV